MLWALCRRSRSTAGPKVPLCCTAGALILKHHTSLPARHRLEFATWDTSNTCGDPTGSFCKVPVLRSSVAHALGLPWMDVDVEGPTAQGKYDELLAGPGAGEAPSLIRASATYSCQEDRFALKAKDFDRQFSSMYFFRLHKMRKSVVQAASQRWPGTSVCRVLDIPEEGEVAIVGTLYKDMKLKPSILDEYVKDRALSQQLGRARFTQADDRLILEDDGARITLAGPASPVAECVTGVVAAVKGHALPSGDFEVSDVCYAGVPPQPPLPSIDQPKYVALVSGVGVGEMEANPLHLQLLVDYLGGLLGGSQEQGIVSRIVRVVVAGGLLHTNSHLSQPTAYSSVRQQLAAVQPVRDVDMCLTELASSVPVDVMPGAGDPSNYSLPQQPLHQCLFPGAAAYPTLLRATNPHAFEVDGVSFLGTSGQNVDDVYRYSDIEDRGEILERLLQWQHLIPTTPDTLAAYPYHDSDPFILGSAPHVLFAGNQPQFATRLVAGPGGQRVRCVAVPRFAGSGCLVLVNLATLACHPITFDASMEG